MKNEEIKENISKKMFLIKSFLFTASMSTGANPLGVLSHGVTTYFLQSIVMELIVKILYEINFKKPAPFNHNILKIFNSLNKEYKEFVELKFTEAIERRNKQFKGIDKDVQFHNFKDVLTSNEKIIKDFKYEAKAAKTNSSVDNIFYNEVMNFINKQLNML